MESLDYNRWDQGYKFTENTLVRRFNRSSESSNKICQSISSFRPRRVLLARVEHTYRTIHHWFLSKYWHKEIKNSKTCLSSGWWEDIWYTLRKPDRARWINRGCPRVSYFIARIWRRWINYIRRRSLRQEPNVSTNL